jgi:phenylacetate-CoA ligase
MHVKVVRIKNIRRPRDYHRMIGLFRGRQVDCLLPAREVLDRLAEIQPDVLGGYAGSLSWMATEATEEDRKRIRPRYIVTGAETMTPDMRRQISDCFGVPIYDAYGAHEVNLLATECKETGLLHTTDVATLVEVLKDGVPAKPGEFGEVVVTALHSYAMPILRYRLRDIAKAGPERCPCGAPFRTIESVQGRVMDRFPLRDGSTMHPYHIVVTVNQESDWLRRYQIVQTSIEQVHVKIVPLRGKAPDDGAWDRIRARVEKAVGPLLRLEFELVEELPPDANGKFRPYYSMVNVDRNADHSEAS